MAKGKVGAGAQKLKGIKCKAKRIEVFQKLKKEGDTQNRKDRKKRQKDAEALGEDAPDLKLQQKTLDNTREVDETIVGADDPDIAAEDSFDEFAGHFLQQLPPRTVVTTSMNPSKYIEEFLAEMVELLPNSEYRKRGKCPVKEMCDAAVKRGFTNLLIFTEDNTKKNVVQKEAPVTGLWVVKLPYGPTARFKLTTLVMPKKIRGHGTPTGHRPELILNNFNTRLGHRMGRMLACLFPYDPQFKGRQVVTLHNQRDFVFFRHHRYVFEQAAPGREVKSTLQELGPRFTLKLKSLQPGSVWNAVGGAALGVAWRGHTVLPRRLGGEASGPACSTHTPEERFNRSAQSSGIRSCRTACAMLLTLRLCPCRLGIFDTQHGEYEWKHKPELDTSRRRFHM